MVDGQLVGNGNAPKAGIQVIFVSANRSAPEQTTKTALARRFFGSRVPAGDWLVYLRTNEGQQVYHSRISVDGGQKAPIMLVSR